MRKIVLAALAALALGGTARAGEAYSNGFEHGYDAMVPRHFGPSHYGPLFPPVVRPWGQSEFDAGIAAGVERGREVNGDDNDNDN